VGIEEFLTAERGPTRSGWKLSDAPQLAPVAPTQSPPSVKLPASGPVRILEQCATMLATLGVEPSEPTRRLIRVQLGPDVPAARD
jgi:hypothetical protein